MRPQHNQYRYTLVVGGMWCNATVGLPRVAFVSPCTRASRDYLVLFQLHHGQHVRLRHFDSSLLPGVIETFEIMTGKERVDRSHFFAAFYLWVWVKNGTWSCRSNEAVLMSGNSHLASAWWSYLKMLWMLRLCISSRTDWISSGNDVGIKSLA